MLDMMKDKIAAIHSDYGELHFEKSESCEIAYSNDNIERIGNAKTSGGNARVLKNNGWGFVSFNIPDFDTYIPAAERNAELVGRGKSEIFTDHHPVIVETETEYKIDPVSVSLEEKNDLIRKYNDLMKHPKIANTAVRYVDSRVERYFVNTDGSAIRKLRTFTGIVWKALARDGTNVQFAFDTVGGCAGYENVIGLEDRILEIKERALKLLDATKVKAGKYRVLLNPMLAGTFVHEAFGHLSESDRLYENPRLKDILLMGKEFGPEYLNIVDDGSLPGYAGYTPFDDEGIPARKNYLIQNGILTGRLHSRETAAKMNEPPSGNARAINSAFQPIVRMTNTFIENGTASFDEMLAFIGDGIYACDDIGGMTDDEMFTFSAAYAYRIRNGKIAELLRDVVLTGNVFSTLKNIRMIGNDLKIFGGLGGCGKGGQSPLPVGLGSPHILIDDVLIGGE
ncbi:MAG: hypothetical protein A2014_01770 [Spirochaetes bacterium GWF1_49_6]|nr:MAG: hypothetical protein A2014_01770 [Spirochaetes bacterium GWF1_49_6]